jgi:ATP-dependent DNA helicase RecQ
MARRSWALYNSSTRESGPEMAGKRSQPRKDTLQLLEEGRTFEEIAQIRNRKVSSIVSMVVKMMEDGEVEFQAKWLSAERYAQIATAIQQFGTEKLKPLKEALPEEITYEEIRLVAAHLRVLEKAKAPQDRGGFDPRCSPS